MLSFHKVHHIKRPIRKASIDLALDIPQHPVLRINTLHEVKHFFQRRYPSFWIRELMRYNENIRVIDFVMSNGEM